MGYSIATRAKSQMAKAEMLAFLAEHYRPLYVIQPSESEFGVVGMIEHQTTTKDYDWTRWIRGDGLSYDHSALAIGFDCGTSGGPEGDYAWSILHWISITVGRKRTFSKDGITEAVPYVVYDGNEAWPVLARSEWGHRCPERWETRIVDEVGFQPIHRPWKRKSPKSGLSTLAQGKILESAYKKRDEMIRAELVRLTDLWRNR
jgi:hypothetical protein